MVFFHVWSPKTGAPQWAPAAPRGLQEGAQEIVQMPGDQKALRVVVPIDVGLGSSRVSGEITDVDFYGIITGDFYGD